MKPATPLQFAKRVLRFLNHDFCPNLNRYFYWFKQPVGMIATATFFSVLVGIFLGPQGFVLACAFATMLVLGLAWPWLSMKGINCQLVLPDVRMWENEEATVVFRVRNFWPLPVFGMMVQGDFLQDVEEGEEPIAFSLRRIPAWSETEFSIPITPRRRGLLPCGEITISNGFPFGLVDISRPVPVTNQSLVWPACSSLEGHPEAHESQFNILGSLCDRSGNDGETIGVRVYRNGDQLRNIHWAQTVRSHRLMVRERQTVSSATSTVLVDLAPEHHAGIGVYNSFEWAIRITASVCYQLHQSRSPVRVVCIGLPALKERSANNGHGAKSLMDFLAGLPTLSKSLELADSKLSLASLPELSQSQSSRMFVVGTSRSPLFDNLDKDVAPIVIDLTEFVPEEERTVQESTRLPIPASILVTEPGAAADQLQSGWRRSFSGVNC